MKTAPEPRNTTEYIRKKYAADLERTTRDLVVQMFPHWGVK